MKRLPDWWFRATLVLIMVLAVLVIVANLFADCRYLTWLPLHQLPGRCLRTLLP